MIRREKKALPYIKVSSLISMGRSSNSVFRLANWANFSSFPMVAPMPRPISAARLANSERRCGCISPFAAAFCESVRSDLLWAPTLDEACRLWTCVRTERNSAVRSCIEVTAILTRLPGWLRRSVYLGSLPFRFTDRAKRVTRASGGTKRQNYSRGWFGIEEVGLGLDWFDR